MMMFIICLSWFKKTFEQPTSLPERYIHRYIYRPVTPLRFFSNYLRINTWSNLTLFFGPLCDPIYLSIVSVLILIVIYLFSHIQ